MLRSICMSSRNIAILGDLLPKNTFTEAVRKSSRTVPIQRSIRVKKEPGEVIKWMLLAIPVGSFTLGCWQTYRLNWKMDLIRMMAAKSNAETQEMPEDFANLKSMEYMPVRVRGEFLHDREILIGPRALIEPGQTYTGSMVVDPKKNQGWLVITPMRLEGSNEVILVNRGWIPQSLRPRELRASSMVPGTVELVGLVRLAEKRAPFMPNNTPEKGSWFYRDLDQMAAHLGTSPVWLDARGAAVPAGWPVPNQTRVTLRNEHLSYLVTWFSLSAATGFMWHRYFVRKLALL